MQTNEAREAKRYNGWTNYETWAVKLWMDNDHGEYCYWEERAQEAWNDAEPGEYDWQTREAEAASALADSLKDYWGERQDEAMPGPCGLFHDLLNAAIGQVDWHEIAEALLSDVDKDGDA